MDILHWRYLLDTQVEMSHRHLVIWNGIYIYSTESWAGDRKFEVVNKQKARRQEASSNEGD